jgi:molybdenum cofactor synthesis domain-containing protein
MSNATEVEIFIIGNEILNGDIQDTNTNWLCKQISNLGESVSRVTVLRDVVEVIAAEIHAALERGTKLILTSGGLGPTADDLTLLGVARGTGVEIELHDEALRMIRDCYDELAAKGSIAQGGLNPAREKMAWLPAGATPLHNPVGSAPGVLFQTGSSTIVSLPGVPAELKGIFSSSLQPFLDRTFSGGISIMRSITVRCNDESVMAPVLSRVVKLHPKVYIKSLANTFDQQHDVNALSRGFGCPEIEITLFTAGTDQRQIDCVIDSALHDLQDGLTSIGIAHRGSMIETK